MGKKLIETIKEYIYEIAFVIIFIVAMITLASCDEKSNDRVDIRRIDINTRSYVIIDKQTNEMFILYPNGYDVSKYDPKTKTFTKYTENKEE